VHPVKYFVIGGRGYVGSALYSSIPASVLGIATASAQSEGFIQLRLDAPGDLNNLKVDAGDVVFLTAAISAPDICAREHERAWAVNVTGTISLIEHVIASGGRVIFFSSDTVYGEHAEKFDEATSCTPAGEYAVMKHAVERHFEGNPLVKFVRLSYVFSAADKFTKYLLSCAQKNETAELFHPFYRAIIHRRDVVEGALALARRWDEFPQQIFNFGGPEVLSRVEFADCLKSGCLPKLMYRVLEPDAEFFRNRPKMISMKSEVLPLLLGRPSSTLVQAVYLEFPNDQKNRK